MINAGIGAVDVPGLTAGAVRRVVWHAALYSPFADSEPHVRAVRSFLERPGTMGMDIVSLPRTPEPWCGPFFRILRGGQKTGRPETEGVPEELDKSWRFLDQLVGEYPDRVRVHVLARQPCAPALLLDDVILFGHYAVSPVPAAQGLWVRAEGDVERMLAWHPGLPPRDATAWERACYRLVSDCADAMGMERCRDV